MAYNFSLFPTLNENLKTKAGIQLMPLRFYYIADDEEINLNAEESDSGSCVYSIFTENGLYSHDEYNFCFERQYIIRSHKCLFGKEGIACANAELGIAAIWTSSESKQRGVIKGGSFSKNSSSVVTRINHEFRTAQLRGRVDFSIVVYIIDPGRAFSDERHLANESGYVLGEIDRFSVVLDGTGSVFPIYEVSEPLQPLWYIKCDWEDPTVDRFSEAVSIYINKANKNYKYIDSSHKRLYDEQLLTEIMSSAIGVIITKLKESKVFWDQTISGDSLQPGSVSSAVNYFINALEWDVSSPENISLSIRKYLEKNGGAM